MEKLIKKYEQKMIDTGLALNGDILMAGLETEIVWNNADPATSILSPVFDGLNINSFVFAKPAEPYLSMMNYLAASCKGAIQLSDNETRTFLHDIPVAQAFTAQSIVKELNRRKAVIIPGHGIATYGTVSPEQAFVNFSCVCFSCFVKFFADFASQKRKNTLTPEFGKAFAQAIDTLPPFPDVDLSLAKAPFTDEEQVYKAIAEVGKKVVKYGFVDSFMGNISYEYNDTLYISQTGSYLDELEGCVDPCPLDNSACSGITASSELSAHLRIVRDSPYNAVLHGHPKFAVVNSLLCDKDDCALDGLCHIKCPEKRFVEDIPIVGGESGTGRNALCNTVPPAVKGNRGAIVYGHGFFSADTEDFRKPFANLVDVEKLCRDRFFSLVEKG